MPRIIHNHQICVRTHFQKQLTRPPLCVILCVGPFFSRPKCYQFYFVHKPCRYNKMVISKNT
jgi:hypothetical protein